MGINTMAKESVPTQLAYLSEKQAEYLNNQHESVFCENTIVVCPRQKCHTSKYTNNKGVTFNSKKLLAYILDDKGNLLAEKRITQSNLTKQTFGKGKIENITFKECSDGAIRGEMIANVSNIEGIKPNFKAVDKVLTLVESYAFKVTKAELFTLPVLEHNSYKDKWEYKHDDDEGVLLNEYRNLPILVPCSVPDGMDKLPQGWDLFKVK